MVDLFEMCVDVVEKTGWAAIVCPWCDVVYDESSLSEYIDDAECPPMSLQKSLVSDGKRLLEVVDFCPEGHPLVRERHSGAEIEHISTPLEPMRN